MPNNKLLNDLKLLAESGVYEFVNDVPKNYYIHEKQGAQAINKSSNLSDLN